MKTEFYTDLENFAVGIGFGKSHKCSGYFYNLSIEFMFFMVVFRFLKVNNKEVKHDWPREIK